MQKGVDEIQMMRDRLLTRWLHALAFMGFFAVLGSLSRTFYVGWHNIMYVHVVLYMIVLGMAVVWGTVKDHKGYIDVESMEGKGTTFSLYFPITKKPLPQAKSPLSVKEYLGRGESILVVDDVEEQREIAFKMLTELGYSVTTVASGEKAIEHLENESTDLVILDMIMDPKMDGLNTYKKIIDLHPGQKAIIASGYSETNRVREAQRLGAGDYLQKPYLLEKVGLAVRTGLDN